MMTDPLVADAMAFAKERHAGQNQNRDRRLFMYQSEHVAFLACVWTPYFDDPSIYAIVQRLKKLLGDD